MNDIRKTMHIEIPAEVSEETADLYQRAVEQTVEGVLNVYTHTGACEESDHCYGPGSNAAEAILARAALQQDEPEYEYAVKGADGKIMPTASRQMAEHLANMRDKAGKRTRPGAVAVSREVTPWKEI